MKGRPRSFGSWPNGEAVERVAEIKSMQIYDGSKSIIRPSKKDIPGYAATCTKLFSVLGFSESTQKRLEEYNFNDGGDRLLCCRSLPNAIRVELNVSVDRANTPVREFLRNVISAWKELKYYDASGPGKILGEKIEDLFVKVDSAQYFDFQFKVFRHLVYPIERCIKFRREHEYSLPDHVQIVGIMERLIKYFFTGDGRCLDRCLTAMHISPNIRSYGVPFCPIEWMDLNNLSINAVNFAYLGGQGAVEFPCDRFITAVDKEIQVKNLNIIGIARNLEEGSVIPRPRNCIAIAEYLWKCTILEMENDTKEKLVLLSRKAKALNIPFYEVMIADTNIYLFSNSLYADNGCYG